MTKKMNIGMVLDKVFPPDDRVEKEALTLINAGYNVFLLCVKNKNGKSDTINYKGIQLVRISVNYKWLRRWRSLTNTIFNFYPYMWSKYILTFINKYQIDMLHIHDLYMFKSGFLVRDKHNLQIPIIGDLHENYPDALKHYKFSNTFPAKYLININKWHKTEQEWLGQLDYVITVIDEMKQRVKPFCANVRKVISIENIVDHKSFLDYKQDSSIIEKYKNKFVINYTGGIDYHRGIDTLINSLAYLKHLSNIILVIVGNDKNAEKYKNLVSEKGYNEKVVFEGHKPIGILQNYFAISDIGIIPHLKTKQTDNSSPNKLYQYMLMGKPVISTNCISIEKVIKKENAGLIYHSGNAKDLAQKIIKLYNDKSLRENLGNNGKNAIFQRLNWENNSQKLIDMYALIYKDLK